MRSVLDYIKAKSYVDSNNIFLCGGSNGGAISVLGAGKYSSEIKGIAVSCPGVIEGMAMQEFFDDDKDNVVQDFYEAVLVYQTYFPIYKKYILDAWDQDFQGAIDRFKGNIIVFQRKLDPIVRWSDVDDMFDDSDERIIKFLYDSVGHEYNDDMISKSIQFFKYNSRL